MIGNSIIMGSDVKPITIEQGYKYDLVQYKIKNKFNSPIIVEDNVRLGDIVKVIFDSKSVKVVKGIIFGADSIVTKNLDIENGIYAGKPAKFLKSRFQDEL